MKARKQARGRRADPHRAYSRARATPRRRGRAAAASILLAGAVVLGLGAWLWLRSVGPVPAAGPAVQGPDAVAEAAPVGAAIPPDGAEQRAMAPGAAEAIEPGPPPGPVLEGRVLDLEGMPIGPIAPTVTLRDAGGAVLSIPVAADGGWSVEALAQGPWRVVASAEGHLARGVEVELADGRRNELLELRLAPEVALVVWLEPGGEGDPEAERGALLELAPLLRVRLVERPDELRAPLLASAPPGRDATSGLRVRLEREAADAAQVEVLVGSVVVARARARAGETTLHVPLDAAAARAALVRVTLRVEDGASGERIELERALLSAPDGSWSRGWPPDDELEATGAPWFEGCPPGPAALELRPPTGGATRIEVELPAGGPAELTLSLQVGPDGRLRPVPSGGR